MTTAPLAALLVSRAAVTGEVRDGLTAALATAPAGDVARVIAAMAVLPDNRGDDRPASEPQKRYLGAIAKNLGPEADAAVRDAEGLKLWAASLLISAAKDATPPPAEVAATEPPEGIHQHDGVIFKVQVAKQGSGRKYAKRLDPDAQSFDYVGRGPLANLSEDTLMSAEEAAVFGRLYGFCVRCGADLTDEDSIARGIGPICATKF